MNRITEENKRKFDSLVKDIMKNQNASGLAVAIVDPSGRVQYEKFWGYRDVENKLPVNEDTIFGVASVTKSFTALSIMQLAAEKKISLYDPISKYIPYFTNKNQKEPVRIWHLLCHSGGFFRLPRIVMDQVAADMGLSESKDGDLAYHKKFAEESIRRMAGRLDDQTDLIGLPGELMSYCNDGFGLLSDIIKNYGDQPSYADYLLEHIIRPLGMERSFCDFIKPAQDDNAAVLYTVENGVRTGNRDYHNDALCLNGGGAMKSTLRDMVKYIAMYLNEGKGLNGTRIVSEYAVREMEKPRQFYCPGGWYGYGLCLKTLEGMQIYEHGGSLPGVSSNISWSYDAQAGIMVLCNTMDVSTGVIADAAMKMYIGKDPSIENKEYQAIKWSPEFIDAVCGDYVMGEGERFSLYKKEDGGIGMTQNGSEKEIIPVSPYMIRIKGRYADGFVQIMHDEERGIWGGRCGSRIYPKVK